MAALACARPEAPYNYPRPGIGLGGSFQNGGGFQNGGSFQSQTSSGFVGSTGGFVGPSVGPSVGPIGGGQYLPYPKLQVL